MKLRNVLGVLAIAATTAALTLVLFGPRGGVAQADPAAQPVVIPRPELASQGCTFTLKTDKVQYAAGESPKIEVAAANPIDKPVSATVWVTVWSTAPTAPMSRMLSIPREVWSHEYAFSLAPDETKSMTADCAALPAGASISITVTDQKDAVLAGNLAVPSPVGPNALPTNGSSPNAAPPPANQR